tara:strand:+ start:17 stop:418 length:402 start_codon:yes stop_codon:yes gene_type:complete
LPELVCLNWFGLDTGTIPYQRFKSHQWPVPVARGPWPIAHCVACFVHTNSPLVIALFPSAKFSCQLVPVSWCQFSGPWCWARAPWPMFRGPPAHFPQKTAIFPPKTGNGARPPRPLVTPALFHKNDTVKKETD